MLLLQNIHLFTYPRPIFTRFITTFPYLLSAAPIEKDTPVLSKPKVSSTAAKGTPLRGINFLKDGKDPVAMADEEYPQWLWDMLDEDKIRQKKEDISSKSYYRRQNTEKIRANNFSRDKKA